MHYKSMVVFLQLFLIGFVDVAATRAGSNWVRINVPQFRIPGEMAQLQCDYDLGNGSLFALKWYKDHQEFYRFVPRAKPEVTTFMIRGVFVDKALSTRNRVILRSVNLETSGMFACEVSAEAPWFVTAMRKARMEVVSFPNQDPVITGLQLDYTLGDEINLNCTSGKSYPSSVIHWYVNDQQVVNQSKLINYPPLIHTHGLLSTILGLSFVLNQSHFIAGTMSVKCVAYVSPVLWTGDKERVVQSLPVMEIRESLVLVKCAANISRPFLVLIMVVIWVVVCIDPANS